MTRMSAGITLWVSFRRYHPIMNGSDKLQWLIVLTVGIDIDIYFFQPKSRSSSPQKLWQTITQIASWVSVTFLESMELALKSITNTKVTSVFIQAPTCLWGFRVWGPAKRLGKRNRASTYVHSKPRRHIGSKVKKARALALVMKDDK